jgi:LmbE family N-acetylglucosaminyl deacetylase
MSAVNLRTLLLPALVIFALGWMVRRRAKAGMRTFAARLCRNFLRCLGRPYRLRTSPCIIFAPHQDDETLGCGALIARKRNEGLPVHVIFITDGSASHTGHPLVSRDEVSRIRRREALAALAILGVESCAIHFLDESDGTLNKLSAARQAALVTRLAGLITEIGPGEIFLPCSPDGSSEHDAAFGFVGAALARAGLHPDIWQYPVWSWWNPRLLVERMLFNQGYCVQAAEDYQLIKTRALARYRSQLEPTPPWPEPALPPGLVHSCNSGEEFFFRFIPPPPRDLPGGAPVI